jgi:uncharacterized paraquat-inducible protein A
MSRPLEIFALECWACERVIELPVPAATTAATCPRCGAKLALAWRTPEALEAKCGG